MSSKPARLSSTITVTPARHGLTLVRESSRPGTPDAQITLSPAAEEALLAVLLARAGEGSE
jgi:hypothetical protein